MFAGNRGYRLFYFPQGGTQMPEVAADTTAVTTGSAPEAANQLQGQQETQQTEQPGSEPAQQEAQQEAQTEQPPQTTVKEGSAPEIGEEHKKLRNRAQKAEQEAAYWRGLAEGRQPQQPQSPQQPKEDKAPVLDDFETYEDFVVAKAEYNITKKQQEQQRVVQQGTVEQSYQERCAQVVNELPDWQDVVNSAQLPIFDNQVVAAVKESELGPKIAYHLAKNPTDARRLAAMTPLAAVREIGRLEAKLSVPVPPPQIKKISQAPAPIERTVSGNAPVEQDESDAAYIARRNKEVYGR
jgi:hypothetical protein